MFQVCIYLYCLAHLKTAKRADQSAEHYTRWRTRTNHTW